MPVSSGHAVDLDAPALVVGEVQVQHVELQHRDAVEVVEHVVDREEVAGDVEHRAAVGEARLVGDGCAGTVQPPAGCCRVIRSPDLGRQQLPQRLRAPEQPGGRVGADAHAVGAALERVALRRTVGRAVGDDECDVGCPGLALDDGQGESRGGTRRRGERLGDRGRTVAVGHEPGVGGERERLAAGELERRGGGDDAGHGGSVLVGVCGASGEPEGCDGEHGDEQGSACGGAASVHGGLGIAVGKDS